MVAPGCADEGRTDLAGRADSDTPNNSKCDKVLSFSVSSKIAVRNATSGAGTDWIGDATARAPTTRGEDSGVGDERLGIALARHGDAASGEGAGRTGFAAGTGAASAGAGAAAAGMIADGRGAGAAGGTSAWAGLSSAEGKLSEDV